MREADCVLDHPVAGSGPKKNPPVKAAPKEGRSKKRRKWAVKIEKNVGDINDILTMTLIN